MRVLSPSSPRPLKVVAARPGRVAAATVAVAPKAAAGWPFVRGRAADAIELPDVLAARAWKPGAAGLTGAGANAVVTDAYTRLDAGMSAYLGDPAVPNWMTFGKYASRGAGEQILRLEETLKILKRADADSLLDTLQDLATQPARLGEQGLALIKLSRTPQAFVANATRLRDTLVFGNTGVYSDVGPAYQVFLQAVASGRDGVAALRTAGYGRAPKDEQGFLLGAFEAYAEARALGERAAATKDPALRERLLERRRALAHEGNVRIGIHEQMVILQGPEVFGDPRMAGLLGALTPKMTLTDARGTHVLLPHGGNWANFAERMGFVSAEAGTPGALRVRDHGGTVHHYVPYPESARRAGTIVGYFEDGLAEGPARQLITSAPTPLPVMYGDGNDMLRWLGKLMTAPVALWRRLMAHFAPASA